MRGVSAPAVAWPRSCSAAAAPRCITRRWWSRSRWVPAGLPPDLRDLCGLRWCFGVATTETAVAALGDDIRQFAR